MPASNGAAAPIRPFWLGERIRIFTGKGGPQYNGSVRGGINSERIETLKTRLLQDTALPRFWDYYMTNFAEDPAFRVMGSPCRNQAIENLLRFVGQKVLGRDSALITDLLLIDLAEFHLVHGCCSLEGRLTCVIYFTDVEAGVIAVSMSADGQMTYARISHPALQ